MRSPEFEHCLVCEGLRQEVMGKLTLLGFVGICPNVDVGVPRLDLPIVLMFVVVGGRGEGEHHANFDVIDLSTQLPIAATAPGPLTFERKGRAMAAAHLPMTFGHEGEFAVRLFIDGEIRFTGQFHVNQATT